MKIVSLLPSATEIVCALGLEEYLVGRSHSCNYPSSIARLPVVTSTHVPLNASSAEIDSNVRQHLTGHEALYDLDIDKLQQLAPDVIVSQALCDVCAVATGDVLTAIENLPSRPQLIDLTPNTLNDVFDDIERVGSLLGAEDAAADLLLDLHTRCERIKSVDVPRKPRVAFLEWLIPPFNGGHWNPALVRLAGGIDLLGLEGGASTTLSWDRVAAADPDVVFIACCGFRVERALKDIALLAEEPAWRALRAVQQGNVYVTDGNAYFSSPGPRLIDGLEVLAHALHPQEFPLPAGACLVRVEVPAGSPVAG